MKNCVSIKSFPNGLKVFLEENASFDEILQEIHMKFSEFEKFFKNTKVALSFEGKALTEEQERLIIQEISNVCTIQIACVVSKDAETDALFVKALEQANLEQLSNGCNFYKGTLKNGQTLEMPGSVIIMGDVYPEATIISKKNIIVLGGLYGHAHAGVGGESCFVAALDMNPQSIKIDETRGFYEKVSKWLIKPKQIPKIAYKKDDKIVFEEIKFTDELLNELCGS